MKISDHHDISKYIVFRRKNQLLFKSHLEMNLTTIDINVRKQYQLDVYINDKNRNITRLSLSHVMDSKRVKMVLVLVKVIKS